jgi:NSS family neurotransmitter:Na+ symporter
MVAAFMVGLGNVWKFPSMIIEYGLSGLAVYIAAVAVLTGMLAAAVETTKKKGYEIMEYFSREYGKPAFALLFLVFDVLLIGYYSIVGGWTLSSVILGGYSV